MTHKTITATEQKISTKQQNVYMHKTKRIKPKYTYINEENAT